MLPPPFLSFQALFQQIIILRGTRVDADQMITPSLRQRHCGRAKAPVAASGAVTLWEFDRDGALVRPGTDTSGS